MQVSANAPTNSFFSGKILVLAITQALCPLGKSRPGTFDSSLMAAAPASDVEASMPLYAPLYPPLPCFKIVEGAMLYLLCSPLQQLS